jgi:hypothetical protein
VVGVRVREDREVDPLSPVPALNVFDEGITIVLKTGVDDHGRIVARVRPCKASSDRVT